VEEILRVPDDDREAEAGAFVLNEFIRRLSICLLIAAISLAGRIDVSAQGGSPALFLPIAMHTFPLRTVFGIESSKLTTSSVGIAAAGASWVRKNALVWRDVEPTKGARNWNAVAALEQELLAARSQHLAVILVVRGVPDWARRPESMGSDKNPSQCGPVRDDQLAAFARFMRDAVARYSASPYQVLYWEMWNEPDVDPSLVVSNSVFGCYGDKTDEYYGGDDYARMLQAVHPVAKAVNPHVQIVVGGLLMDCDPDNTTLKCNEGEKIRVGRFFEGILRAGGGAYFDVANIHSYDRYVNGQPIGTYSNVNWTNTQVDGPVLLRKVAYLRDVLARYGHPDKPIMNTETAVICAGRNFPCDAAPDDPKNNAPNDNIQRANAYYIAQSYAAAKSVGLLANIHYSYEGWNGTNMVVGSSTLLPYHAFQEASARLAAATYVGPLTTADAGAAGLTGYKFLRNGKPVWVVWSLDGVAHTLIVTGAPTLTTALGESASTAIGYEPVYVEWP
jgi:hypothetical protein